MISGFATIADLQSYWKNCEDVYLQSISSPNYQRLAERVANLYSYMLEYQIRAICLLSKKQLARAGQKMTGQIDWAAKEKHIVELSDRYNKFMDPLQQQEVREYHIAQNQRLENICSINTEILETMKDQKQADKEERLLEELKIGALNYRGGMDYNPDPVLGTCEWFFADGHFSDWREHRGSGVFWVAAGPGCGKSVLARTLITHDHLKATVTTITSENSGTTITSADATICYYFFKDDPPERAKITTALCAVLHQLFTQKATKHLLKHGLSAFAESGRALAQNFDDLWNLLLKCAIHATTGDIVCVIDALDECNGSDRRILIEKIDQLYADSTSTAATNLKFLITSRPYDDIEQSFAPLANRTEYFCFDVDERHEDISRDIGLVIDAQVDTFAKGFKEADRRKICDHLKLRGTKTYLWLHLTLDIIKRSPSRHSRMKDVEALLKSLPTKVSDAYEKILTRPSEDEQSSNEDDDNVRSTLLRILLTAARPLTLDEANFALTMALADDEMKTHAALEEERWPGDFKTTVKNLCGLIISVYDGRLFFIHLTAREFLLTEPDSQTAPAKWRGRFANLDKAHETLSRCCMRYLLLQELSSRSFPLLESDWGQYPLLEYAAANWTHHYRKEKTPGNTTVQQARHLCSTSDKPLQLWGSIYITRMPTVNSDDFFPSSRHPFLGWSDLGVFSFFGLLFNAQQLLVEGADVNESSDRFGSALHTAVLAERHTMAAMLLSEGASVHVRTQHWRYPLDIAALTNRDNEMMELLLSHGANPLTKRQNYQASETILEAVAWRKSQDTFAVLVAKVVDVSTPDAVLAALSDPVIEQSEDEVVTMMASMLVDSDSDMDQYLSDKLIGNLLDLPSVAETMLQKIEKRGKQRLLLEPSKLRRISHCTTAPQILARFLRQTSPPCVEITQAVLEVVVVWYDPATFELFFKNAPPRTVDFAQLLLAACYCQRFTNSMLALVLDLAGPEFVLDTSLCKGLLRQGGLDVCVPVFFRYPQYIAPNARVLLDHTLRCRNWPRALTRRNVQKEDLVRRILDHCDGQLVIDEELLCATARSGTADILRLFLSKYTDQQIPVQEMYEYALRNNSINMGAIFRLLLETYGSTGVDLSAVLSNTMKNTWIEDTILNTFLQECSSKVTITADALASVRGCSTLEVLSRWLGTQLEEVASAALRIASSVPDYNRQGYLALIDFFPSSLFHGTEQVVLNVLDWNLSDPLDSMAVLMNKLGDQITITERILAAAASDLSFGVALLEMINNWRPGSIVFTQTLVEAMATIGAVDALAYLEKESGGKLIVGQEWHNMARFRLLVRKNATFGPDMDWKSLYAGPDTPDVYGKTALHRAAQLRVPNSTLIEFLLATMTVDINARDYRGRTALHFAVDGEDETTVQMLLDAGADPTLASDNGETPIWMAEQDYNIWMDRADMLADVLKVKKRFCDGHGAEERASKENEDTGAVNED